MGWIISIILIIAGAASGISDLMVAAGIFAIAGELGFIRDSFEKTKKVPK